MESTSSAPINEILDCATEYSDYEDGLKELAIEQLPLSSSVKVKEENYISKCWHLFEEEKTR